MEELINIGDQQFYYSTIDQVVDKCSQKERCAIIVDEHHLGELLAKGEPIIGKCVNQIIIISDKVNSALEQLENKDVLLLAALDLQEAIRFAILGEDLNKHIICVPKVDGNELKNIIELLIV